MIFFKIWQAITIMSVERILLLANDSEHPLLVISKLLLTAVV